MTAPRTSQYAEIENLSPRERVERLIGLTGELTRVVEAENALLRNKEPFRIGELHEEKMHLSSDYAMDIGLVGKTPHVLDQAPAELVAHLKGNMSALQDKLNANEQLLGSLKDASEELVKTVAGIAAKKRRPATGYGQSGRMAGDPGTAPSALSLDRRI